MTDAPADPARLEQARAANAAGMAALRAGNGAEAAVAFRRALEADPAAGPLWRNLAHAERLAGNDVAERAALDQALALDRTDFVAQLRKAQNLERCGAETEALAAWSGALQLAQGIANPVPGLADELAAGRAFVAAVQQRLGAGVDAALGPLEPQLDETERRRIRAFADHALGRRQVFFNEARFTFGRTDISGLADGFSMEGTGSLTTGTIAGSRLVGTSGPGSFTGVAIGTEIYLSGGGVTAGYYKVLNVAADGSYVTFGEPSVNAEDSAGPDGTTGVSYQIAPNRFYLNGNLGSLNGITQITFESGPTNTDILTGGQIAEADGESVRTSALVYDSEGGSHPLEMMMVLVDRSGNEATWRWYAESPDNSTYAEEPNTSPPPAPPIVVSGERTDRALGWGDIVFDENGLFRRAEPAMDGSARVIHINLTDQARDPYLNIVPDFSAITQFVSDVGTLAVSSQDGFPAGVMQTFSVGVDGIVRGIFSNGVARDIGQLALADFANVNGLLKQGENTYVPGVNSGDPLIAAPTVGGLGAVRDSSLELSNVELAEEFTELIVAQRGFQANARVITTSDEMLSELMNLVK